MSESKSKKIGLFTVLGKFGGKILSFVVKGLKLSKVGLAALSLAGYSFLYSWKFAILMLVSIGWHESGHVWAMKKMKLKTKGFYFLPFIGGVSISEDHYSTYGQNAFVSIMGPIWGLLLALFTSAIYLITHNPLWASAAVFMTLINLFNLLPTSPLDGGQVLKTIAFSIHKNVGVFFLFLSLAIGAIVFWYFKIWLFLAIILVGGIELYSELRTRIIIHQIKKGLLEDYPNVLTEEHINAELGTAFPQAMKPKQIGYAALSYLLTLTSLFGLVYLLKNAPGADIVINFLQ